MSITLSVNGTIVYPTAPIRFEITFDQIETEDEDIVCISTSALDADQISAVAKGWLGNLYSHTRLQNPFININDLDEKKYRCVTGNFKPGYIRCDDCRCEAVGKLCGGVKR